MKIINFSHPIAYYIIQNETVIDCNDAFLLLFNYDNKTTAVGKPLADLTAGDPTLLKEYLNRVETEGHCIFPWFHKTAQGDAFQSGVTLIKVSDTFVFFVSSEMVKAVKENPFDNDDIRQMNISDAGQIILIIDPETGNILNANANALSFYGYSKPELTALNLCDISLSPASVIAQNMERFIKKPNELVTVKHLCATQEVRDVEIRIRFLSHKNHSYFYAIIRDITDRIRKNLMLNNFFAKSPYAIAIIDNYQQVIDVNPEFTNLFQYDLKDLYLKNLNDVLTTQEYHDEANNVLDKLFNTSIVKMSTLRKRKDNTLVNVEIIAFPIIYNNTIIGAFIHYIDITKNIKALDELEVFRRVLENSNEAILITDHLSKIEWINNTFTKITGYTINEIKNCNPRLLQSHFHSRDFYQNMWNRLLADGFWQGEVWNKNKNGNLYPEWLSIYAVKNNGVITHYVGVFKDLSESKTINQKMRVLAQKDALTGLFNRLYFTEKFNQILKSAAPDHKCAVLFIDLDRFKEVNDSLGHQVGDECLIELAKRINQFLPENDLIARYGGDEFVILLNNVASKAQVTKTVARLYNLLREPFNYLNNYLSVSSSIGISLYPDDGNNSEELIQNADIAMYVAKNSDSDNYKYYKPQMKQEIAAKIKTVNRLNEAIQNKAFTVLFEPVYELSTGALHYLSTGIRWNDPLLKKLSVSHLAELANHAGHSLNILKTTLNEVLDRYEEQNLTNYPLAFKINAYELENNCFMTVIKETARGHLLKLELSNVPANRNISRITRNIRELNKAGFDLIIDGFDKISSNLSQIISLQASQIKLDKNMLAESLEDYLPGEVLKTLVRITKHLNLKLIAQGINDKTLYDAAINFGIPYGAGTYFSGPLSAEKIHDLMKKRQ